jgi:hypothetical protein
MTVQRRREGGQSLVETALLLPVFVLVLIVIFDLGRAVYAYSTIGNAARTGGRVAIVNQLPAEIRERVIAQSVALGLTDADVSICYEPSSSPKRRCGVAGAPETDNCVPKDIGCLAIVEARYSFAALTPLVNNVVGPIQLSSTTVLPVEAVNPPPAP